MSSRTFFISAGLGLALALEPAVLEVVGAGAEVRFDTGSITETSGSVSVDSRANSGCTKVDGFCVYSQFNVITQLCLIAMNFSACPFLPLP
jgi:hypothetical protein